MPSASRCAHARTRAHAHRLSFAVCWRRWTVGRASHPTHKPTPTPTPTPTPSPTPLHQVSQHGDPPAFCHKQSLSCWGPASGLRDLEKTLLKRKSNAPPGSYTARLFGDADLLRKKLVEEAQVSSRTSHLAPRRSPLTSRLWPHLAARPSPRRSPPPVTPPSPPPVTLRRAGAGRGDRARPRGSRGCGPLLLRHGQARRRRSLARDGALCGGHLGGEAGRAGAGWVVGWPLPPLLPSAQLHHLT